MSLIFFPTPTQKLQVLVLRCLLQNHVRSRLGNPRHLFFKAEVGGYIDSNFQAVSAVLHKEEAICNAFVIGVTSNGTRQRLLQDENLILQNAFK